MPASSRLHAEKTAPIQHFGLFQHSPITAMSNSRLEEFEYEPLDDDSTSFRLLVLAPGTWDATLDCTLVEDSREAPTFPYEALSVSLIMKPCCSKLI